MANQETFDSSTIKCDEILKFWTWFYMENKEMQKRFGLIGDHFIDKRAGGSILELATFVQKFNVEYQFFAKLFTKLFVDVPPNQEHYMLCLSSNPKEKSVWIQSVASTSTNKAYTFIEAEVDKKNSQHFGSTVHFKPCFMVQYGKGHFGPRKDPSQK